MKSIFTFSLILLSGSAFLSSEAHAKKTFVYCSEGSPSIFNPQLANDGTTANAVVGIYNKLIEFKLGETTLLPALATSWSVSADQLTYTLKLRKGVQFHTTANFKPTRNFNADDVLFTFNRERDPKHPFHKVNGGSYEYFESMDLGNIIKDIVKVDDYTIQFILTRPEAPFLADLAMDFAAILSAEYGENLLKAGKPEKIDTDPVGTGPFVFSSYAKDQMIRFKAFPNYYEGKAKIDELVFSITPDASVRFQKLKAGECHLIIEPPPADLPAMRANPKLKVIEKAGLNVGFLAMNTEKQPLNNVEVRRAINMALNKNSYIDAIYLGSGVAAKNPIPPTIWSYNHQTPEYVYNTEASKKLLAKAGYPNGFEIELWTLPVTRPYNPNGKKMGEMMQADLAKVGIKAKLVTYDWPTYLEKTKNGEHSLAQLGWTGDNGDPDNFLAVLLGCASVKGGSNIARFCHAPFEKLVNEAKVTSNVAKRTNLYKKAQIIFYEQAPWVPIAHSKVFRAMTKNVVGYKIDPVGREHFYHVDLE